MRGLPFRKRWYGVDWEIRPDCRGGMMVVARTRAGAIKKAIADLTADGQLQHFLATGKHESAEIERSAGYRRYVTVFAGRPLTFAHIGVDKVVELPRDDPAFRNTRW